MRRPIIATIDNGLPMRLPSRRDFLFPDADEKYVPAVLAYIHDTEVETLNTKIENVRWAQVLHFASESSAAK